MKQKSALLEAMAKGNGGSGGSGGGGSGGGGGGGGSSGSGGGSGGGGSGGNRRRDHGTKAICPNCNKLVVHAAADYFTLPVNKDKVPTWYKPPKSD